MKVYRNDITIARGESFTIDRSIINRDGTPYVISSKLANPYFLITVASDRYDANGRMINNYWLSLVDQPRFLVTVPEERALDWSNISNVNNDRVYYRIENGEIVSKYFAGLDDESADEYGWKDYKLQLIKTFLSSDTSNWVDKKYLYSIKLVSGEDTKTFLKDKYEYVFGITVPDEHLVDGRLSDDGKVWVYDELYKANAVEMENININRPIQNIDYRVIIQENSNIFVTLDLIGGI